MDKQISDLQQRLDKAVKVNNSLCDGCYWQDNKPLTPVCGTCRIVKSNYQGYEHSLAETKTEEYNG